MTNMCHVAALVTIWLFGLEANRWLTRNPYADYMCFQRADQFSLSDLRGYMDSIYDTDFRLKSSGSNPRLVMERLILGMCLGAGKLSTSKCGKRSGEPADWHNFSASKQALRSASNSAATTAS